MFNSLNTGRNYMWGLQSFRLFCPLLVLLSSTELPLLKRGYHGAETWMAAYGLKRTFIFAPLLMYIDETCAALVPFENTITINATWSLRWDKRSSCDPQNCGILMQIMFQAFTAYDHGRRKNWTISVFSRYPTRFNAEVSQNSISSYQE